MADFVTLLDRAPGWLRRRVYGIAAGRGVLGRIADAARFRFADEDIPALPAEPDAAVRLFVGPANSAGQGMLWCRAAEHHLPGVSAVSMRGLGGDEFQAAVDLRVPVAVYQRSAVWHSRLEAFLERRTHVIWESGLPLLGRACGSDVSAELARLASAGVHGALLFHGSDVRLPSWHAARNPWSPFRVGSGPVRALEETATDNLALARTAEVPVFVSTPDLLALLPTAAWCPVVVDTSRWGALDPVSLARRKPLVVAHAPSRGWIKGTDRIEPTLHALDREGVIEYRRAEGIPHDAMPDFYAAADVVLDQFLLGSYGVAACEAMAAGRLVVGHVDEEARASVRDLTGRELPILEADVESLESVLRGVADDPEAYEGLRASGPAFVGEVHDGRRSAAALAPFLGLSA